MASALLRLPVEIWANILSVLIYPPLVPRASVRDYIENAKLGESERRNLRLVCTAWNAFAEDEIRLVDVSWTIRHLGAEAPMPLHYARRARVLSCHEDMIWGPTAEEILQGLHALVQAHIRMSVLSIEVCIHQFSPITAEAVLSNNGPAFSSLTHLRLITHLGYAPENGIPCDLAVSLPRLQVLEYHHSTPRSVKFLECSLPSLQCLSIGYLSRPEDLKAIIKILEFGGLNAQRLRSLTLVHPSILSIWPRPTPIIPASLWTSCPRLEEFAADFKRIILEAGPSIDAALAQIIDTQEDRYPFRGITGPGLLEFIRHFRSSWPSVQKARFTAARWRDLFCRYIPRIDISGSDLRIARDLSIELLDAEGLNLFEVIGETVKEDNHLTSVDG